MKTGSKKELLDLTKRKGRVSIDESVSEINLAKTTIREHFTQLENEGLVERQFVKSGPGRPSIYFQLTPKGNSLYPSYEPDLMREFIKYLKENENEALLEDFFERFWQHRFEEAQKLFADRNVKSDEDKLRILTEMLAKEGFMPEYKVDKKDEMEIRECNCPFTEIVKETTLPCKLEKEFLLRLLGDKIERTSYIPDGDYCCSYKITH